MTDLLRLLTPFLVGIGSIAVIVLLLFLCAWCLSDEDEP